MDTVNLTTGNCNARQFGTDAPAMSGCPFAASARSNERPRIGNESLDANRDGTFANENWTIPLMRPLPVTKGRLLDFPDDPVRCMRALHAAHGPIAALEEDGQRIHFVFTPEYNHQVLSDPTTFHSRFFALRGGRNSSQRRLTSGLLSMNGDEHKKNRRLVMEAFTRKTILEYIPTVSKLVDEMLADWQPGDTRDLNRDMTELMLRVTSSILFGVDNTEMAYRIGRMVDEWVHMNHELGMGAFVADSTISGRYSELLDYSQKLEEGILELIEQRRRSTRDSHDVLSILLNAHAEEGAISDGQLVGQTALLFAAAHLTTAHSLAWTMFLLAQHPQLMSELHSELTTVFGDSLPRGDKQDSLPYLDRVIKESMRVLPASSYSQRLTSMPTQLGPFELPAGSAVVFSQFMTHHSPEIYSSPESFVPDRWLTTTASPYAYLPFGSGPRMCVGGPLSLLIIKTALPKILTKYRLSIVADSSINGKVISTMLCPTTPIPVTLAPQDGQFAAHPVTGNIHELVDLSHIPSSATATEAQRSAA
jgi:cytochrome P450